MSLHKIAEQLRQFGLNENQIEEIIEMVRQFCLSVLKRNLGL